MYTLNMNSFKSTFMKKVVLKKKKRNNNPNSSSPVLLVKQDYGQFQGR